MTMQHPAQRILWQKPAGEFESHFVKRVKERAHEGVDAPALEKRLYRALWERDEATISYVMGSDEGGLYYRTLIDEVPYYVVVSPTNGRMVTFLTQAQFRGKKFTRKMRRQGKPPRGSVRHN